MRSVSIPQLYSSLYSRLIQIIPDGCDSRVTNMALLMFGMVKGQGVQTGKIAAHLPIRAKKQSLVRRLERFLDNRAVRVLDGFAGVSKDLLSAASVAGDVH